MAQNDFNIPFTQGLSQEQQASIQNLVGTNQAFNETDAKNFAFATGQDDFSQFVGKTGLQNLQVPSTVDAASLDQGLPDVQVPPQPEPPSPEPFAAGIESFLDQFNQAFQQSNQEVEPLQQEQTTLTDALKQQLDKLTGKGQAVLDAQQAAGVPAQTQQLQDLNTQIAQVKGAFDKAIAGLTGQGRGITTTVLGGQQGRLLREQAAQLGALTSLAQAVQGNIALAKQTAQEAVDLKFSDKEQQVLNTLQLLELNKDALTKAEQKQAAAAEFALNQQLKQIQEAKEEQLNILNFAQQAAQNGAPNEIINDIINAESLQDAFNIGSEFLAAEPEAPDPITLSPGQKLVDPVTGETIAVAPKFADVSVIGQNEIGQNVYGVVNPNTGSVEPINIGDSGSFVINIPDLTQPSGNAQLAKQNNNPGNLRFVGQAGASPGAGNFAKFATAEQGFQALMADIEAKKAPGGNVGPNSSLAQMLSVYAPPSENDTQLYINQVANALGVSPETPVSQIDTFALAQQIVFKESGTTLEPIGGAQQPLTEAQQIAQDIMNPYSNSTIGDLPTALKPQVISELNKLKEQAAAAGDILGMIQASAGGKAVTGEFQKSFEKALSTLGQLSDLQQAIQNEATGPITGIIKSKNPYDTKAQQIKAQLTSIVPNLARGIFGEVGVLTDQDVALYSQTLPNLKSTEQVNQALLGITVKTVQRAIENKIKSAAALGMDVSGLGDIYIDVKNTADNLLLQAGIVPEDSVGPVNDIDQQYVDSLNINSSPPPIGSGLGSGLGSGFSGGLVK